VRKIGRDVSAPLPRGAGSGFATVNGVRLHCVEAGSGPPVVLLHGFPEFWYAWRHQIPALAEAGFRAVAPDLRGYNLSEKPPGVGAYELRHLVADVAGLIRWTGAPSAVLVGHDWGGVIAWHVAKHHPDLVRRLIILNAPHPVVMKRELGSWAQRRRSWYAVAFQIPALPELAIRALDFAILRRILRRDPVRPGAFTGDDIEAYVRALSQPGALTATINYYRALRAGSRGRPSGPRWRDTVIAAPTLLIWGERDRYLGLPLLDDLERLVDSLRIERIPDASHWVQADAPERVNELILDFLGQAR
jgi:pimeloyl-ACP methyl ester carboxylesterase